LSVWKQSLVPPSPIADPSLFIEPEGLVSSLPVQRQFFFSVSPVRLPSATVDLLMSRIVSLPFPKVSDSPLRAFTITLEYDTSVTISLYMRRQLKSFNQSALLPNSSTCPSNVH
jgi:hypothetical protein